ncbi:MAG: hypothetical protein AVDCRST_MAG05-2199 [uncultured Rubrobacteraceae bacterium]|uniref:Alkyl hydroperoxide reductase subunit C/ Thiol specific antioxidant domain-containing protein n=1 Tax=uncultured Rubrobacteraceae bacterium TaxID=349277 RepID=A0A6J4SN63_9ACTN|nr:MAG: hypothetical protein AVDCRST_MAG05-2199 [uncultured Rubrobacteraceae bacterium]
MYGQFEKRGFGVAGVSIDPPSSNRAMVEKLGLPFPLLSDPRGDLIKSLGLWNEGEGVSEPAIVVLDGSGEVRHLYSGGSDFSDRPTNEDLLEVLDGVEPGGEPGDGGPAVRVFAEEAENDTVRPEKPAMTLDALRPYYLGAHFTSVALQKKLDDGAKETVAAYQGLVNEYGEALRETARRAS